ncbi:MAG: hypothetical protein E6J66_17910 [Deltaproteobacteria bacterium]|nr:MAG: hypothetical protein E6J66_17910 [Deltaproteobacteria bacterium]
MARTDAALMPDVSEAESARGYLGSVFRLTVDFLEQRGCKAQVKQKVSAATAQLIDKPPFPFAWIPATPMDEVESALSLVAGRDACVDLGLTAARKLGGSLIQPVLKMATALFGNTPVAVFQNLERFYAMVLKGMKFDYDAVAPREAVIRVRAEGGKFALRPALLPRWRSRYQCRRGGIRALGLEWDGRGGRPGTAGASIGRDRRGTARTPAAAGLRAGRNALRQRNVAWKITCTYSGALIATGMQGYVA